MGNAFFKRDNFQKHTLSQQHTPHTHTHTLTDSTHTQKGDSLSPTRHFSHTHYTKNNNNSDDEDDIRLEKKKKRGILTDLFFFANMLRYTLFERKGWYTCTPYRYTREEKRENKQHFFGNRHRKWAWKHVEHRAENGLLKSQQTEGLRNGEKVTNGGDNKTNRPRRRAKRTRTGRWWKEGEVYVENTRKR